MPEKERSLSDLKEQVTDLQEEIHRLEGKHQQKAVKTLFRWQSFSRPYAKRSSKWFLYTILLVATILLLLLFMKEFIVMAPVLAIAFVAYILATVPPELVENEVTTQGINNAEHSYLWDELDDFWITEKRGFTLLHIDTFLQWPRRLIILINKEDKEKAQELIARYLPFRELPKTGWFDSLADAAANGFHKLTN